MHKALITLLAVTSPAAHARYAEEAFGGGGPPALDEANLLPYVAMGLALWLWMVWGGGWRARVLPVGLAIAGVVAWVGWGNDGLGLLVLVSFAAALLHGALRRN